MGATAQMINFRMYSDGKAFDLVDVTDRAAPLFITDYSCLDREIIIDKTTRSANLGGQKPHEAITSIAELRTIFEQLLAEILQVVTSVDCGIMWLGSTIGCGDEMEINLLPQLNQSAFDFSIDSVERSLLAEQFVFDILFDKYLNESKLMTRNGYSAHMVKKLSPDANPDTKDSYRHTINERLTRGMTTYHDRMAYSELTKQIELLGIDPKKYAEYYNPRMKENPHSKKPKIIWDLLYYNFGIALSSRQYRRQLTRENRNYSYEAIFTDLKEYAAFVNKLLPVEFESCKKYFHMSMDYYVLESYKRVDFMFKLIAAFPQTSLGKINKEHYLVRRFHPLVLVPYQKNGVLHFNTKHNYYRPLLQAEDALHKQQPYIFDDSSTLGVKLQKYQIIRAKAYELFKYHYVFRSNDYAEIKRFLCECYDMRSYHQSNTFWNLIQDNDWRNMDNKTKQHVAEQIRHFLSINDALFWKSSDREYTMPETNS